MSRIIIRDEFLSGSSSLSVIPVTRRHELTLINRQRVIRAVRALTVYLTKINSLLSCFLISPSPMISYMNLEKVTSITANVIPIYELKKTQNHQKIYLHDY